MLAAASKVFAVKTDERVARIREVLPGVNCGACGYTGCDGYAGALIHENATINVCIPGGNTVSKAISGILGVASEDVIRQVAVVYCSGDRNARLLKMDYSGIQTCAAAKLFHGGQNACGFGCIGYGDCAAVCPEGAICVENGLAYVDALRCTGCGICVKVCPNNIILIEQSMNAAAVLCKNTEKGADVRKECSFGCIACMKCVRECPEDAITVSENLASVDPFKCDGCGKCAEVCVTGCIRRAV